MNQTHHGEWQDEFGIHIVNYNFGSSNQVNEAYMIFHRNKIIEISSKFSVIQNYLFTSGRFTNFPVSWWENAIKSNKVHTFDNVEILFLE